MLPLLILINCLIMTPMSFAILDSEGAKCGQKRCSPVEYCSPFDTQCRPCSIVCDVTSHNRQHDLCVKDCQEYLHDQRYVLRSDIGYDGDLRGEIQKLRTLTTVSISLTCIGFICIVYLLIKSSIRWKAFKSNMQGILRRKWVKKVKSKNKVQDDVETGAPPPKQNGGLTLSVQNPPVLQSSDSNIGNTTPNTTSTPLSRRHPSEDTTLDYAYDNPAMTPSPEAAQQQRPKHESSF